MQEFGFSSPRRTYLTLGSILLGRALFRDGKHQGGISRPGYMGKQKVRRVLPSRKEKLGGKNMGIAFSLQRDVIKKMAAVLNSKEDLK